jgi:putrescine aminotransferase
LREIRRQNLPARAADLGQRALARLSEIQAANSDMITEVRGRGLLIGIEFTDPDIAGLVIAGLAQRRVIAAYTLNNPHVIRIEPALTISEDDLSSGIDALAEATEQAASLIAEL